MAARILAERGQGQLITAQSAIAAQAAKLLQSGESLTATARAFGTFEANKAKQEAKRQKINHFKEVAVEIVGAAREDAADPVKAGLEAQKQAKAKEAEKRPLSPEEARQKRLHEHWASDWTPYFEAMKEQAEQEEMNREMEKEFKEFRAEVEAAMKVMPLMKEFLETRTKELEERK